MIKKLRLKFICVNMLTVVIILGIIFGLLLHFMRSNLEKTTVVEMTAVASEPAIIRRDMGELGMHIPYFTVQVLSGEDRILVNGTEFKLGETDEVSEVVRIAMASDDETGVIDKYSIRYLKNQRLGSTTIVFADISREQATLKNLMNTCLVIGGISLLAFFALSLALSRWAIKPVKKAWDQQKQFVSDASHELKTPLTVILTNAEMLQSSDFDESMKSQFSENILAMSTQMRSLVENLLDLARADNGSAKKAFERVDYSKLIEDCILPFEPLFYEADMSIVSDIAEGVTVHGSAQHLRQVTDILLDNARKYGREASAVEVSLKKSGHHCQLRVVSEGEELSREQLKNIFKRFYRADESRTSSGSYGLGLPIADAIISEHGGRIWAESSNGKNTFIVQLKLQ